MKNQLLFNQAILVEKKRKRRNLAMAWIEYKKAYTIPGSCSHKSHVHVHVGD